MEAPKLMPCPKCNQPMTDCGIEIACLNDDCDFEIELFHNQIKQMQFPKYTQADFDAHTGAVLAIAANAISEYPCVAPDEVEAQHYDEQIEYAQSIILALRPDAMQALERVRREARVEGMRALLAVGAAAADAYADPYGDVWSAAAVAMADFIAAEERIAQAPPGKTLLDEHDLPGDEADGWNINVGEPRAADSGEGE